MIDDQVVQVFDIFFIRMITSFVGLQIIRYKVEVHGQLGYGRDQQEIHADVGNSGHIGTMSQSPVYLVLHGNQF